jgi:uncharacterized protein
MKIYAIADLHLSFHENIDKPMRIFGSGWDDYEARLSQHWHERISDEDVVILAGDHSWGLSLDEAMPDLDWIHNLPGRKILIKGNHDLWWSRITYLNTLYDDMKFIQNDSVYLSPEETGGESIAICGTRGWILPGSDDFTEHDTKIWTRELGRLRNSLESAKKYKPDRIIAAIHYPPADDTTRQSDLTDLMEEYGVTDCIYGHLHGMHAFIKGIKNKQNGISYYLTSLDYLGTVPKKIWDSEDEADETLR